MVYLTRVMIYLFNSNVIEIYYLKTIFENYFFNNFSINVFYSLVAKLYLKFSRIKKKALDVNKYF